MTDSSERYGKPGVRRDPYAVAIPGEDVVLTPLVGTPERELLVWQNRTVRDDLAAGLRESAAGDVVDLGSFAQYVAGKDN